MRAVWIVFRKDWQRARRDPYGLAAALAIPLVLAVLITLVFGREPARPQGRLLVVDEDGTIASSLVLGAFSRDPLNKMVLVEQVSRTIGVDRINRGDASALLIIPHGFQEAFVLNQPCALQLFTNPSESILPQIVQESMSIMVDGAFYLHRIAGGQLQALSVSQRPSPDMVAQVSVSAYHLVDKLRRYLNPPVIDLETSIVREKKETLSFGAVFLPSMIFMGLLLIANSMAIDIWKERLQGTLQRLAATPMPLFTFLAGRLLFVGSVFALFALIGLVACHGMAGMPVPDLPAAVAWMVFTGTVFYVFLLLLVLLPSTARGANVTANMVVFPLAMIGGCFFPFEWMPDWMARAGRVTPNGWAITQFKAILAGSVERSQFAVAVAGLLAIGAVASFLALRRLRSAA